jgi:hypothetical protein
MGGLPGARPRLNQIDLVTQILTGGNQNVEINIFGESLGELSRLSRDVMGRVRDVPGYENVDVNWQDATPELQWKVDRQKGDATRPDLPGGGRDHRHGDARNDRQLLPGKRLSVPDPGPIA